ncbi:hypothetical protein TVAG_076680 [Trichomonas vaginalis G3]|uniref:Uncharacterized protein n=1 Tax=Trichomonas vaginalis (strain ATCC PRA-98 / G3) TaxID=412133 RepID=A2D9R5_TRIV3|nr:putative DNA-binding domain family [Trichomonas vaginalis G3]EAY22921.1 hypothetical protein TVAG_076680 [Trichomonas vaginalis G3]KAI5527353.1 putative DNA-binding domain family [Trichomonas vaginalis G3]|eukprot:XP_001583907.1 hypothetical protein [Trichomonas vaginalis G3]
MATKDKTEAFRQFLRQHNIGEPSPAIPEDVGKHLQGVPFEEDLVKVPDIEQFPLPTIEKHPKLSQDEMKKMLTQAQIESVLFSQNEEEEVNESSTLATIDTPNQYSSAGHFISVKRALSTSYAMKSEQMGLPTPVVCCKELSCTNAAVPTFDYCINHLSKDPRFKSQKFVKKCAKPGCSRLAYEDKEFCFNHLTH